MSDDPMPNLGETNQSGPTGGARFFARRWAIDLSVAAALFLAAFAIANYFVSHYGGTPDFEQKEYGPAVAFACGHGYINPDRKAFPTLQQFLRGERNDYSCAEITTITKTEPLNSINAGERYLLQAVSLVW